MPIYEYRCEKCETKFEAIRSMKDADAEIACKNCHSTQAKRSLSLCFSRSEGHSSITPAGSGCGSCHGGSCSSCGH